MLSIARELTRLLGRECQIQDLENFTANAVVGNPQKWAEQSALVESMNPQLVARMALGPAL